MTFTIIDAAIIFIYLMGMLVLGFIMGKTNKTQEDYFVAKRSLPWLPIGLSIAATMISCNSFVGGPGWGKGHGAVSGSQPGSGASGYHHAGTFRPGGAGGDAEPGPQYQGHYVLCRWAGDDDSESPDHRGC